MKKIIFISFCSFVQTFCLFAQDSLRYKSKWQTRPSVYLSLPLTKLLKGEVTDHLFEFDDKSFCWQVISLTYFFHKHWGLEANYQAGTSNNMSKRGGKFRQSMQDEYSKDYYVTPATGASFDGFSMIERIYLGMIYRLEGRRFCVYPKVSIGVTSFFTDWGNAYLKEKNTHHVKEVSYLSNKKSNESVIPNDHVMLATSVLFGYKLRKNLFLNFDILASHYKTNITFTKTITELNTLKSVKEEIVYKKNIFTLNLGTGLIIVIN